MSYSEFAFAIRVLCSLYDASISGGIRSEKRNAGVGGVEGSRHQLKYGGKAVDLVLDDMSPQQMGRLVKACQKLGFYAQDEGDHVHTHDNP